PQFVSTPSVIEPRPDVPDPLPETALQEDVDPHLRACNMVMGYHIVASDGDIGHVKGILVDEETWAIRYFIVDTSNWWLGHQVLIAPEWIEGVSWSEETVTVDLTRQAVKDAPPYDPAVTVDLQQESEIRAHYGRADDPERTRIASPR
ncbi:MAG TPA: PRC-barrel domain-containing protein, partial [Xanthomonadaceae bacterium]|nr:PRC-barrel domain-containing protein [Xanthomonadaceae bacterium]